MCDPHSELVQCSISPLCVSVWRLFIHCRPHQHISSIYPPALILLCGIFSSVTVARKPLHEGCVSIQTSSTAAHTINMRAALCGPDPEHIYDHVLAPRLFLWFLSLNGGRDAAHPPRLLLPDWR